MVRGMTSHRFGTAVGLSVLAVIAAGVAVGQTGAMASPVGPAITTTSPTVTGGSSLTCTRTGTISCWGTNIDGRLGRPVAETGAAIWQAPAPVEGLPPARDVAVGLYHACAIRAADRQVVCWGRNRTAGQLGQPTTLGSSSVPLAVPGVGPATALAAGRDFTCAILVSGEVICWGANSSGQAGTNARGTSALPTTVMAPSSTWGPMTALSGVVSISTSRSAACAVTTRGMVACWGFGWSTAWWPRWIGSDRGGDTYPGVGHVELGSVRDRAGTSISVACLLSRLQEVTCRDPEGRLLERDRGLRAADPPAPWTEHVNARYRRPLGLPDIARSNLLDRAATNHANYWALNGPGAGMDAHYQEPGRPGFTGVAPWDRCVATGEMNCGEIASPRPTTSMEEAIDTWMSTPYHGTPLLAQERVGCGLSSAGAVCNLTSSDHEAGRFGTWLAAYRGEVRVEASPDGAVNAPSGWLRVWPASGMRDVPVTWAGGEIPDPLASYTGDRRDVGPVLFLLPSEPSVLEMTGPQGQIPLLREGGTRADARLVVGRGYLHEAGNTNGWDAVFPARRLSPGTTYMLTIRRTRDAREEHVAFTTRAAPSPVVDAVTDPPVAAPEPVDPLPRPSAPAPVQPIAPTGVKPAPARVRIHGASWSKGWLRVTLSATRAGNVVIRAQRRGTRGPRTSHVLRKAGAPVTVKLRAVHRPQRVVVTLRRGNSNVATATRGVR